METIGNIHPSIQEHEADVFWGEISPCEHLVQIYQDEGVFLDALEGFIAGGILAGDGVVVIATPPHLASLNERLRARNIDVAGALKNDQYIALDAEETLSKFMVMGWPDEDFFRAFVSDILKRAKGENRRVRAFGEMVALLWLEVIQALPCTLNTYGTGCAKSNLSRYFVRIPKLVSRGMRRRPYKKFALRIREWYQKDISTLVRCLQRKRQALGLPFSLWSSLLSSTYAIF